MCFMLIMLVDLTTNVLTIKVDSIELIWFLIEFWLSKFDICLKYLFDYWNCINLIFVIWFNVFMFMIIIDIFVLINLFLVLMLLVIIVGLIIILVEYGNNIS